MLFNRSRSHGVSVLTDREEEVVEVTDRVVACVDDRFDGCGELGQLGWAVGGADGSDAVGRPTCQLVA